MAKQLVTSRLLSPQGNNMYWSWI